MHPTPTTTEAEERIRMTRRPQSAVPFLGLIRGTVLTTLAVLLLTLLTFAPAAHAKQAVDFFGGAGALGGQFTDPNGVAVNDSGAGPADAGDVYAIDSRCCQGGSSGNRIERFGRDDGGTPGNTPAATADDTYFFISAWGADVVSDGGTGDLGDAADANYEICTLAAQCQFGVPSGGNGTAAGNGALDFTDFNAGAVAVDQDTGNVFVTDAENHRVSVYDGTGVFLRSFGFDVAASGPGDTGSGYEVCVAADGDVCKAGVSGSGAGQLGTGARGIAVSAPAANPTTGTVFLADSTNHRVNTYNLDGSGPASIGSAAEFDAQETSNPKSVAVDSRGILYADNRINRSLDGGGNDFRILRYDTVDANRGGIGFLAPLRSSISENQRLNRDATAGQYRLTFNGDTTADLAFDATPQQVRAALEALPSIGAGNVAASGFIVRFTNDLANDDVAQLVVSNGTTPLTGTIDVTTIFDGFGGGGANEVQEVTVAATAGTFNLSFDPDGAGPQPSETTIDIPFNWLGGGGTFAAQQAPIDTVQEALHALPSIPPDSVRVEGGPGDASGSTPYRITFSKALGARDVAQLSVDGSGLSGGAGASVATVIPGQSGLLPNGTEGLAVDPDTDGGGPDTDALYVGRGDIIQQFGPLNDPGLSAPPSADDDRHNTNGAISSINSIAVEPTIGRLYAAAGLGDGRGVYVIDTTGPPPTASLDSVDNVTATCADLHATIDPNGPPLLTYHFEYSDDGGTSWDSAPEVTLGIQTDPQAIDETFCPAPIGLSPNTDYLVRLVATRRFAAPLTTAALPLRTDPAPPLAETAGAPVRTTTTAQINGRVIPRNSATTYHFEYGEQGPCSANPCALTPSGSAGSGDQAKLVAEELRGLTPDTTYHYRLLASNGVGAPVPGADITVHTRASDVLPGQSDTFPGPPGSDRAWEMVSLAESSGNPIGAFYTDAFSDDGSRAVYGIAGGTPISPTGTFVNPHFAQRTPGGWQTDPVLPPRDQLAGSFWSSIHGSDDLSTMVSANEGNDSGIQEFELWRLTPGSSPTLLHRAPGPQPQFSLSADGTRAVAFLGGAPDPAYPAARAASFYDVSSGTPQLLSLLPGDVLGPCAARQLDSVGASDRNWISDDGSLVYFATDPTAPCVSSATDPRQLYVRDLLAGETRLISGPPLTGPECGAGLVKAIPGAAFFATKNRLDLEDAEPANCDGEGANDVYRYDLGDGSLDCLTCIAPGFSVGINGDSPSSIAVAEDGSRLYFTSGKRLAPGAPPDGQGRVYRIDVASGNLAYVARRGNIGTAQSSVALSADGSILVFASDDASLNPLGGTSDNGGGTQYYRYSDADRSIVCISCPQDGSPPLEELSGSLHKITDGGFNNNRALSADGGTLAFVTTTPLHGADQNTPASGDLFPGTDVYEWRDGRQILVSDGLTSWAVAPLVEGVDADGTDVFFDATAAYTPDAPDDLYRLYTARIGGGIEFPPPGLPPCDLNSGACEGPASSAHDFSGAGTAAFEGQGDPRDPFPRDCSAASERAAKLDRLAQALRESARRANPGRAKALRRKAAKLSRQAKNARGSARSCRRANRRAAG
jgi:NHL repeat-containing protein